MTFMSFQMDSEKKSPVGMVRYKSAEGKHRVMGPAAIKEHLLYAQLLHYNRVSELPSTALELPSTAEPPAKRLRQGEEDDAVASNQQDGAPAGDSAGQGRSAEGGKHGGNTQSEAAWRRTAGEGRAGDRNEAEESEEAAGQKKREVPEAEKEARRKRDRYAAEACDLLTGKDEWQEGFQTVQMQGRSISRFRIAAAARGEKFSVRRYDALAKRSFLALPGLLQGLHRAEGCGKARL